MAAMSDADLLAGAEPRSPRSILDELAARSRRAFAHGRQRPDIAIYLSSGPVIAGRLVSVGDDRGVPVAILHVGGNAVTPRVASVRVDQVIAVIHDLAHELIEL